MPTSDEINQNILYADVDKNYLAKKSYPPMKYLFCVVTIKTEIVSYSSVKDSGGEKFVITVIVS